jgi:leader peptidase (prepilin peptidase)/N-methyltransferase
MSLEFDPLILTGVTLLAWLLGSFCTVLCYRIPREIPLGLTSHTRSKCSNCNKVIPWHQNIPLVTYLLQKGRCAQCKAKIPLTYFLIELSTLILMVSTYLVFENSVDKPFEQWVYWAQLITDLYFTLTLVAIVFIDIEFRIIPDRFSIGNWIIALAAVFFWGQTPWVYNLLGGLFGFGVFFLMAWGYEKLKGVEGLGFGDVKMMGWLGTWLGLAYVPFVILIGSITGLIVGLIAMRTSKEGFKTAIPFGPFLALGAYTAWVLKSLGLWG